MNSAKEILEVLSKNVKNASSGQNKGQMLKLVNELSVYDNSNFDVKLSNGVISFVINTNSDNISCSYMFNHIYIKKMTNNNGKIFSIAYILNKNQIETISTYDIINKPVEEKVDEKPAEEENYFDTMIENFIKEKGINKSLTKKQEKNKKIKHIINDTDDFKEIADPKNPEFALIKKTKSAKKYLFFLVPVFAIVFLCSFFPITGKVYNNPTNQVYKYQPNNNRESQNNDSTDETTETPITIGIPSHISPVASPSIIYEFSINALNYNSALNQWQTHSGIDISGTTNSVYCFADGIIENVETEVSESIPSLIITISHANNYKTIYKSVVSSSDYPILYNIGTPVAKGTKIADYIASGDNPYIPHLHFELHLNNERINPQPYIYGD